jgi:alpha-glucuronidase
MRSRCSNVPPPPPQDGYRLWLRYQPVEDPRTLETYRGYFGHIGLAGSSETVEAIRRELQLAIGSLLGSPPVFSDQHCGSRLVVGTPDSSATIRGLELEPRLKNLGNEGFLIEQRVIDDHPSLVVAANHDHGLLYGVFHLLLQLSAEVPIGDLPIATAPKLRHRMLNHWDNLDRTVERGYAGFSLWDWHKLPDYVDLRLIDYARANASIGLNGTVLTNVNANALILTGPYLRKVAKLADVLRPYGIRVYLTARFNAPVELKSLNTADPLEPEVVTWWQHKVEEIYRLVPDFGGFVVKANSEGQPGPQAHHRNHADGANLLAQAVARYGGIVIWRAFVYDAAAPIDRAKQANLEFEPLDGKFLPNACLQVKNGAIDFQPREPFHPMFGKISKTPLFLELQITQEYLGQGTHLVFLAPLFAEVLHSDTFAKGQGSTVARVIDGSLDGHSLTGIAGVSNIGNDRNWCGHPFAAANWFAFGRLAWDTEAVPQGIAEQWLALSFSRARRFVEKAADMMLGSREACVNYMTPLGLHHLMAWDHHYGPGPWIDEGRPDWTSVYYHRADKVGIGFDRTASGSNALEQYHPAAAEPFRTVEGCPERLLLWFHHVPWDHRMRSGRSLWDELCWRYHSGVEAVRQMQATWRSLEPFVDVLRFAEVTDYLRIQEREACWWRDACTQYFQQFSGRPLPSGSEPPAETLEYYRCLNHYYVPGIPERRFG